MKSSLFQYGHVRLDLHTIAICYTYAKTLGLGRLHFLNQSILGIEQDPTKSKNFIYSQVEKKEGKKIWQILFDAQECKVF